MTGDQQHVVLHDTKVPGEAEAIARHRAEMLGFGAVVAKEH